MLEQLSPLAFWGLKTSHSLFHLASEHTPLSPVLVPETLDHPQGAVLSLQAPGWDVTSPKHNISIQSVPQQSRLCIQMSGPLSDNENESDTVIHNPLTACSTLLIVHAVCRICNLRVLQCGFCVNRKSGIEEGECSHSQNVKS